MKDKQVIILAQSFGLLPIENIERGSFALLDEVNIFRGQSPYRRLGGKGYSA